MRMKKITVDSMPEAVAKVRQDFGDEAVILHSRPVKVRRWFGLKSVNKLEVYAGIDDAPPRKKERTRPAEAVKPVVPKEVKAVQAPEKAPGVLPASAPAPFQSISAALKAQEVNARVEEELMNRFMEKWYEEKGSRPEAAVLEDCIGEWLEARHPRAEAAPSRMIQLVGQTGVGKTTTLAKLGAREMLRRKKSIAFFTTDTFRMGAVDQLNTYASIMEAPVHVIYDQADYREAVAQSGTHDYVFIDSAGRNFLHEQTVEEAQRLLPAGEPIKTVLVLSLTAKYKDMKEVAEKFLPYISNEIIITKADETTSFGALLNIIDEFSLRVAFVTTGQEVPEDIESADNKWLAAKIAGGTLGEK
ncbi:hypothetical protein [Marinococcus halotolerans]|uniref:flagellar biosynthesis protein FlhF n=1 Tax=Marinococcus halotolerans TaxID=301092 RepID=UPI0003B33380|nr:hypothetical protein [Marinococcus halotolerans]